MEDVVSQFPFTYRAFARYAAWFFARSDAHQLPAGRAAFRAAALAHRVTHPTVSTAALSIDALHIVVDLSDPRLIQVVNELSQQVDTAFLPAFVREGDTFLDVGANHGAFALVASQLVGETGYVLAVEPQPHLAAAVERSLAATAPGSYDVHAVALGDREGVIDLLIPRSYSGTAGVFKNHSGTHPHRRLAVPLRRFDDLLQGAPISGSVFLKLDIEGSEYAFVRGAMETLRAHRPVILMEVNRHALAASHVDEADFRATLGELGYATFAELDSAEQRRPLRELVMSSYESQNLLFFAQEEE